MRESDPTKDSGDMPKQSKAVDEFYQEEAHARTLCFTWLNGKRMFMNYSYLVSGEYRPEENAITLTFTSHTFILKGVNLETLFNSVITQLVRNVACFDPRYNIIGEDERFIVNEIDVDKSV